MSEEKLLSELVKVELKFSDLLTRKNPPEPEESVPYKKWS
jgi:hypothetical protein